MCSNLRNLILKFYFQRKFSRINSKAAGRDSWVQSALKSILRGHPFFESSVWFLVTILKFIFTSIFKIEKKIPWHKKNFIFEGRFLLAVKFILYLLGIFWIPEQLETLILYELQSLPKYVFGDENLNRSITVSVY